MTSSKPPRKPAKKPARTPRSAPKRESRTEDVLLHGFAHGGEAVGRLSDGKAVFVSYALPGERVRVHITDERARWARGVPLAVLEPSADRIEPECPLYGECGGCTLQHIAPARRQALLRQVLIDQLERIGGLTDPPVEAIRSAGDFGYRNTARFAVTPEGGLGFRAARSRRVIPVPACPLLTPETQALREEAGDDWIDSEEVIVRAASRSGGRTLITIPGYAGGTVTEHVGGFDFRISPGSFFQQNTQGAEILLELVREAAAVEPGERAVDLYAGVGLFARGLAQDGAEVIAVESSESAVADARENLAELAAEIWHGTAEEALDELGTDADIDVVVLDPPRAGAGADVVTRIAALRARVIVYVSCDPAALARDVKIFGDHRYRLQSATPVDQFAQTGHLETVAVFTY